MNIKKIIEEHLCAIKMSGPIVMCDAPECDYEKEIGLDEMKIYIGAKCPLCDYILATSDDYRNYMYLRKIRFIANIMFFPATLITLIIKIILSIFTKNVNGDKVVDVGFMKGDLVYLDQDGKAATYNGNEDLIGIAKEYKDKD